MDEKEVYHEALKLAVTLPENWLDALRVIDALVELVETRVQQLVAEDRAGLH